MRSNVECGYVDGPLVRVGRSTGAKKDMQETRWFCCKSRGIGRLFKAVLCGSPRTTSGGGMIVSERFRDTIASVKRFDDTGCSEQTKEFKSLLDDRTAEMPLQDMVVVAGDPNGHVGAVKAGYSCHGGLVMGHAMPMALSQTRTVPCETVATHRATTSATHRATTTDLLAEDHTSEV
ncbi:unnamed protein product [Heligmosomoides polygyrus]|uniref:Uncharacterized protein n=1 Tax=Heligmosomoides polygyrus TaxID=6339 RepID=A0A183FMV1_HELPZ|nr:unnamed protein product [Heligmosomoides polygyrus]